MDPYTTHGAFSWSELTTPDLQAALAFYGQLFGWTSENMDMGTGAYHVIMVGETGIGGVMAPPPGGAEGRVRRPGPYRLDLRRAAGAPIAREIPRAHAAGEARWACGRSSEGSRANQGPHLRVVKRLAGVTSRGKVAFGSYPRPPARQEATRSLAVAGPFLRQRAGHEFAFLLQRRAVVDRAHQQQPRHGSQ
jgi:catechol 2,3-dioxygenase-like lactoylglutathione lyase family enzyme